MPGTPLRESAIEKHGPPETGTRDDQSHGLFKTIALYSSSKIYNQGMAVVIAFLRARFLTPELFGLWNLLNVVPAYTVYSHLGTRSSMRYLIPYHMARGEEDLNRGIWSTMLWGSLYLNIAVVAGLILWSFRAGLSIEMRIGLIAIATIVLLAWYIEGYLAILRSYQQFKLIIAQSFINTTATVLCTAALVYLLGIYGVYLTTIIVQVLLVVFLTKSRPLGRVKSFSFETFRSLVKIGFPILIFDIITTVMATSGRLVVSSFLGNKQLGYFALSTMVFSGLTKLPGTAREVMEPRMIQDLQGGNAAVHERRYFLEPLFNTAYYMPFMIGVIFFTVPGVVGAFLPQYLPGVRATQFASVGVYFLAMCYVFRGVIVANGWQGGAALVMGSVFVVGLFGSILLVKAGFGIDGVAACSSASYVALFACLLGYVASRHRLATRSWGGVLRITTWPAAVTCAGLAGIEAAYRGPASDTLLAAVVKVAVFTIIMSLVVVAARRVPELTKPKALTQW